MFDRNAGKIQRKFWYQNMKMNFIIGGVVLVIIIIIIIVIVTSTKKDDNDNPWLSIILSTFHFSTIKF